MITAEESTELVKEVNNFFITQKCENLQRNLELFKVTKKKYDSTNFSNYFKNKKGIWLIGYDGYVKAYSEDNFLLSNIHNLIDEMPIRKQEIRELKKNC